MGEKRGPQNFSPGGKIFPPGEKFLGVLKTPQKGGPLFKNPRGFLKTPGGFSPFLGEKGAPKNFSPGEKFFPRGKNFWGFLKTPKKGPPFLKPPGVFKNPRGFSPFLGEKGGPQKFFPRGKNFPPGENFWGFLKPPKRGPLLKPRGF
ncbi:hypothetical protein CG421_25635 [Shigella sonnei]|nr:hypothetical protein CG421_25635 [Shigella sonnei]